MEQISNGLDALSSESYGSWVNFGIVETIYENWVFAGGYLWDRGFGQH